MTTTRSGLLAGAWQVARVELTELRSSPGLYLFIPLILLQTIVPALVAVGVLDTPLLITSGTFAVRTMGIVSFYLCLLFFFYTVESLERERSTRLSAIAYATPIRTGSLFLGKGLAMIVVGLTIILAVALAGVIVLLIQRKVGLELRPFFLVWGLLLTPTVMVWIGAGDGGAHDHPESIHDLCSLPGCAVLHGLSRGHQSDQLGRQLAALGHGEVERYQHPRVRPHGPGFEPDCWP